jgi:hypothetical protein
MAEDRSQYRIDIKTSADVSGAEKQKAALKDITTAARQTGEELNQAGRQAELAHEKGGEGAHKAELKERELKESVRAVAQQFGGLADVGLWVNPMTAGLAAVLFLVDQIKEHFNSVSEAAAQLAEQADALESAKLKSFAESAKSAAEAMQALAIEQEKLNTAYAAGDSAMDNRVKQYAAEKDAVLKVAEAKEQAFEAEIHQRVVLGTITKEAGEAAIAQAKLAIDAQRGVSDQAKLQDEIAERKKQLAQARNNLLFGKDQDAIDRASGSESPLAAAAAQSEEAAKQAAQSKFDANFKSILGGNEPFHGTIEDLKKLLAGERDKQNDAETNADKAGSDLHKFNAEQLQEVLTRQQQYIANLERIAELDKQHLTQAKARTEAATEQYRHDSELDRSGADRIAALQQQLDLQKKTTEAVQAQHEAAARTNAQTGAIEQFNRLGGNQAPSPFSTETGPQAIIDAREAITKARIASANLRYRKPGDASAEENAELHGLLDEIVAFSQNHSASLASLRGELQDQRRIIQELLSRESHSRAFGY